MKVNAEKGQKQKTIADEFYEMTISTNKITLKDYIMKSHQTIIICGKNISDVLTKLHSTFSSIPVEILEKACIDDSFTKRTEFDLNLLNYTKPEEYLSQAFINLYYADFCSRMKYSKSEHNQKSDIIKTSTMGSVWYPIIFGSEKNIIFFWDPDHIGTCTIKQKGLFMKSLLGILYQEDEDLAKLLLSFIFKKVFEL